MKCSMFGLCVVAFTAAAAAQHSTTRTNPFASMRDVLMGSQLFKSQCASCHALDGTGGAGGPDLTTGKFRRGESDEALFQTISKGVPGTPMPAFGGNGREAWQIVAYVRSFGLSRAAEKAPGDRQRGRMLFESAGCQACHAISGQGGTTGPELSGLARRRSLAQIESAIVDPEKEVAPDYWMLRARTKNGRTLSGVRLNEDTYSYQILESGSLKTYLKVDLEQHEIVRTTLMPSYRGKFSTSELENLVAFLASLEGGLRP